MIVVAVWCDTVERMGRARLDAFTRDRWRRFDERELGPLRDAILRRRRILARQAWS